MSLETLQKTFENELSYCISSMKLFSKLPEERAINSKRRLAINQFKSCWEKFGLHLNTDYVKLKLVESGELLLSVEGFQDVAKLHCFTRFLEHNSVFEDNHLANPNLGSSYGLSEEKLPLALSDSDISLQPHIEQIPESHPLALKRRCEYGSLICDFLEILHIDVSLISGYFIYITLFIYKSRHLKILQLELTFARCLKNLGKLCCNAHFQRIKNGCF
jgi:hypothetical protein